MADQAGRITDKAKEQTEQVQEQSRGLIQRLKEHAPNSHQVVGLLTLVIGGITLATIGGGMIMGTIILLLLGTPIFLLFSPILVPLGILAMLAIGGFLATVSFFLVSYSVVTWVYNYAKGRHPVGADKIEAARHRLMNTATHMTEKAREYGCNVTGYLQQKAQDVAPGA